LIGHYESASIHPLVLAGAGILAVLLQIVHPRPWTIALVTIVMVLFIGAGVLGMYFHFHGSSEFQREMDPTMAGMTLVWHVLRAKSPPTLSPGTMIYGHSGAGYT
jgi:1,4-dihydroxy-2-naphthoate octaprenyltransferase